MKESNIGLDKNSFSISFKGGEIWIEHLDSIQDAACIKEKFIQDLTQIKRPSTSSFIAINLEQSDVNEELLTYIIDSLCRIEKPIRKVVFLGLQYELKQLLNKRKKEINYIVKCMDDFEKAKEWLF